MVFKFDIPVPSKLELLLAKTFGKKRHSSCMDSHIITYTWRGKTYVTKQWIDKDWSKHENLGSSS